MRSINVLLTLLTSTEVFRSSEVLDTIAFYHRRDCNDTRHVVACLIVVWSVCSPADVPF